MVARLFLRNEMRLVKISDDFLNNPTEGIKDQKSAQIWDKIAHFLALWVRNSPNKIIAGSVRRHTSAGYYTGEWLYNLHDVEIVCELNSSTLLALYDLKKRGVLTASMTGEKHWIVESEGIKYDIFGADRDNWGLIMQIRTGPDNLPDKPSLIPRCQFNHALMGHLKYHAPFVLAGGYLWLKETCEKVYDKEGWSWQPIDGVGRKIRVPSEQAWFRMLGLPYIEPHKRTPELLKIYFSLMHEWGDYQTFLMPPPPPKPEQSTLF